MSFTLVLPVRFADCDFAGIGYYPRLLALIDAAIEDWSQEVLGVDRAAMRTRDHRGLPTVSLTVDFETPCRLGEQLALSVNVTKLGVSSISLGVSAQVDGAPRFSASLVQVLLDTETGRATHWPDHWRVQLQAALEIDGA